MLSFTSLMTQWEGAPIAGCPGRFVLRGAPSDVPPEDLVGGAAVAKAFHVPAARDLVLVVTLADGGLISYRRADGTYLHTLNTSEGLARKLAQLGIEMS
jgi:hypothetical protein